MAASHHRHHAKAAKPRPALLHCTSSPTMVAPQGQSAVDQPNNGGDAYGPVTCSPSQFGSGVMGVHFTISDSGDMVGKYTQWFQGGTLSGTFDLQPGESPPLDSNTFYSESFSGQVLVTGGTNAYQGIKSKDTKGTMSCNSPDSVHFACTQNVTVLIPAPVAATGATASKKS